MVNCSVKTKDRRGRGMSPDKVDGVGRRDLREQEVRRGRGGDPRG